MKKEIAEQWVAALRSGKYQQGRGLLREHDSFCCLGVLCDISEKGMWTPSNFVFLYECGGCTSGSTTGLPIAVRDWAGFDILRGGETMLAQMNDKGMPFTEIADYIEEYWEQLA